MLIDRSYFIGEINIPNQNQVAVSGLLDLFIQKYEPEFLEKVLGYSLYRALIAGYSEPTPAQKWVDLVQGKEYTCYNRLTKWKGLITQPVTVLDAFDALQDTMIIVGRGNQYDPASGTNSVIIPPEYVGKEFRFYQRVLGQLGPDEYTVSGNTLTLTNTVFAINDRYFYKTAQLTINTSTGSNKQSPIAMYVYYWFCRNAHTQTTSMGEVKTTTENSEIVTPAWKMTRVWLEMFEWIKQLVNFLDANKEVYPEWKDQDSFCMLNSFKTINEFNL